jgi:UDP-glucose 4-epimerase
VTQKVLVVGAAGFIGKHLVHALVQGGVSVSAIVNQARPEFDPRVQVLGSEANLAALLARCDAVVWLASATTPASSAGRPLLEVGSNLVPLLSLLQALQGNGQCQLVYVSSGGTVYGDVDHAAEESLAPHPRSFYAAGKAAAELFIEAHCQQHAGNATILRPSNVYGPGQTLHGGFGVIPAAMACLRNDKPMTLWGDGESLRDFLYIEDFIAACIAALNTAPVAGLRTYNVCSGEATSLNELLAQIETVAGRKLLRDQRPARAVDLRRVLLDGGRARKDLHWLPQTDLRDGLLQTWQWFSENA